MIIQVNTDHNIAGSERLTEHVKELVTNTLSRFSSHLTRVEVHIVDEAAGKAGHNDKKCVIEARMEGTPSVAVTEHAATIEQAAKGALEKLKGTLDSIIGKTRNHDHIAKDALANG